MELMHCRPCNSAQEQPTMKLNAFSPSLRRKTRVFTFRRVNNVILCSISPPLEHPPLLAVHMSLPHISAKIDLRYVITGRPIEFMCAIYSERKPNEFVRRFWRPRNQNVMRYYVAFNSIFISTGNIRHTTLLLYMNAGNMRLKIHLKYTKMCVSSCPLNWQRWNRSSNKAEQKTFTREQHLPLSIKC